MLPLASFIGQDLDKMENEQKIPFFDLPKLNNKFSVSQYANNKDQKLNDVEGIQSLIVDKLCISDEEGMGTLISHLQKYKKQVQGIVISDFEGAFKVDYLKRIELALRDIQKLRLIVIHNSNLTREHIQILRNIIWWRRDQLEKIVLNKNSIDSFDFKNLFVSTDFNFTDLKNLKTLEVKVQPGINKLTQNQFNEFTNLIPKDIIQKAENKPNKNLYISLDETSLNYRNRKLLRQNSETQSTLVLEDTNTEKLFYQLSLGSCFSDKNEGGLRYFGESLIGENFDDITLLSMKSTNLKTQQNWIPIFTFLKRTKTILELDLSSCFLNDKIVNILFTNTFTIKKIDISDNNNIQLSGWKKIFESVICNPNTVTDNIKLNNCYFNNSEIISIGDMILQFSKKMKNKNYKSPLTKFYFNNNPQIQSDGWSKLFNGLLQLTRNSLETLELRECNLNEEKINILNKAIASAYQYGGQLDELNIRGNPSIGESQSLPNLFDTIFKLLNNFKKYDIASCRVSDINMVKILQHQMNSDVKLSQIVIKNNPNINKESYKLIAQLMVFTQKSSVDKIDISSNKISQEKLSEFLEIGKQFAESGKKNLQLRKFIFNQNQCLEKEAFQQLVDLVLLNNKTIMLSKLSLKNTLNTDKSKIIMDKLKQLEEQNEALQLQHLCLDKNIIQQTQALSQLIAVIMQSKQALPHLKIFSLAYCNLINSHIKELLSNLKNSNFQPINITKLILKGNVSLTNEGWLMISYLIFQSRVLPFLETLDISYCKLEETCISSFCLTYQNSIKDKPDNFKHSLKELIISSNPQLDSDDWQFIFDTLIFSKTSNVKSLIASDTGFDSRTMQMFVKKINQSKKEFINQGYFDERHQLVNLNIEQNQNIDEESWKQFISIFVLNKLQEDEMEENLKQQQVNEADNEHVREEFKKIEKQYRDKLISLNITNKQPIFQVKYLDLKGTSSIYQDQWLDIFSLLIINNTSQIEFLGLSQTYIEKSCWDQITKLINDYVKDKYSQLKITTIQFNDNQYIQEALWKQISNSFFFNKAVVSLKTLELESCKINQTILDTILDSIQDQVELETLKLKRNVDLDCIRILQNNELPKLRVLECDKIGIPAGQEDQIENIKQMRYSLQEITLKLQISNPKQYIEQISNLIPNLKVLNFQGELSNFNNEYQEIIEFASLKTRLGQFSARNQNLTSESLFPSIVQLNAHSNTPVKLDIYGTVIDKLSKEQSDQIKFQQENNVMIHHNTQGQEEKTQEQKEKEKIEYIQSLKPQWEKILQQGHLNNLNKSVNQNLISLNISNTMGLAESSTPRDCSAIEFTLNYVAKHCSSLTDLNISNCFMSEKAFQNFCLEYSKNQSISISNLNVSNNQHLKTDSWKVFFQKVIFQKKSSFKSLDLSKNLISKAEFEILKNLSSTFNSKIFKIEKLYLKNLQKSIEASAWVQLFFFDFIKVQNRKVENIFLNDSLSQESQNGIFEFLAMYLQNSNCNIQNIYGYHEMTQLFRLMNPNRKYTLNLQKELKINSQFVVIDMWKYALVSKDAQKIKCQNALTEEFVSGIPHMNLDLILDFLQPMDNEFCQINQKKIGQVNVSEIEKTTDILCFDYETIKLMSKYFNQKQNDNSGNNNNNNNNNSLANPIGFILNKKLEEYLTKPTIFKQIYFIQHKFFSGIETTHIAQLYTQFKSSSIDSIIIDYDLRQNDLGSNFSERDLIDLIRLFPPKSLELTNVSINALKAIYSILSSNNNFRYANVNFSSQSFINNGMAFSLREKLYMGKKTKNFLVKILNQWTYSFLDIFCTEGEVYKFDKTVPKLNENLKKTRIYFNIMIFLTFIYYAICIFCPYFLTNYFGVFVKDKTGVAWESHYVYLGFAVLSGIVEVIVYQFAYKQIKHLIPKIVNVDHLDTEDKSIIGRFKLFFKERTKLLEWISYLVSLALSQFDRFDLYSDICFIVISLKMEQYIIAFVSFGIIANQLFTNICKLWYFLYTQFVKDQKRVLNTHEINAFCELSNLIEFEALNNILDTVAPYNISFVPNNWLFRFIMPSAAGHSISNRLLTSMQKFIFEDAPQIVVQLAYVIEVNKGDSTIALSIFISFISLIKAFYKFMSIRPSTISQLDFDSLSKAKRAGSSDYNESLKVYRDNMLENLQKTITNYSPVIQVDINNKS